MPDKTAEIIAAVHAHRALLAEIAAQRKVDAAIAVATQRIVNEYARPTS